MYSESEPGRKLEPFVECFWRGWKGDSSPAVRRILPDGCVDLIFDLTSGCETAFWVGTMTKPLVVEGGPRDLIGIRFHPGGARGLLDLPLSELRDERVPFQAITPSLEKAFERLLHSKAAPFREIQFWLAQRLVEHAGFPLVQSIFRRVRKSSGNIRVADLASSLGLSRQYLNRVMKDGVGVDLKMFCRVLRMRACTQDLRMRGGEIDWPSVASDFGFYDQSHLIHDFNDIVGLSPLQFLNS